MEEQANPQKKLEELEAKKRELIEKIRGANTQLRQKREEIIKLVPALRGKAWVSGKKTRTEVDDIEFEIATRAYTPAQERLMLKRLKKAQEEMDQAIKLDGVRDKVEVARKELEGFEKARNDIATELDKTRAELDTVYKEVLAKNRENYSKMQEKREGERRQRDDRRDRERSHQRFERGRRENAERRKEEMKEIEPYMKKHDDFVSLEEIAEIKKKPTNTETSE